MRTIRCSTPGWEMATRTTGTPAAAPATGPAISVPSLTTTSGQKASIAARTPGSAARASMPTKTSANMWAVGPSDGRMARR